MSNLQLERLESLWRSFKTQSQMDSALSVASFARQHPESQEDILKLFPLMSDLNDYADDPLGHPDQIGGYRILRQIGIGGMGVVYEASEGKLREKVALKVVQADALDRRTTRRLEQEARVAATLHHGNIVPVYDYGADENAHFYAMRLIDGPNLAEVLHHDFEASDELTPDERTVVEMASELAENWLLQAKVIRQAARAIAYAHSRGVLHRDVKPANLLLAESFHLWVTDFGLARFWTDEQRLTPRSRVMGTPRYMAPEQIRGESDERSDIFGLGLTLYEMVLLSKSGENRRKAIWKGGLRRPIEINDRVPPELDQLIMKAVSMDPEKRHASAEDFIAELDRFISHRAAPVPDHRPARQSKLVPATLTVALLLLLCGGVFYLASRPGAISRAVIDQSVTPPPSRVIDSPPLPNVTEEPKVARIGDNAIGPARPLSNRPPTFSASMFDQADNRTLVIAKEDIGYPIALSIDDDRDSAYDGLHVSMVGGNDQSLFGMTPMGVFALLPSPESLSGKNLFQINVAVSDRSRPSFFQVRRAEDATMNLIRCALRSDMTFQEEIIATALEWPDGLIDMATANGSELYHLHHDESGSASLYVSQLNPRGQLKTKRLHANCGLSQNTQAIATRNGKTFMQLESDSRGRLSMWESVLHSDGSFSRTQLSDDCLELNGVAGLSCLDENQFALISRESNVGQRFFFSFRAGGRLIQMPISQSTDQFTGTVLGQAAWVEKAPGSVTTSREIDLRIR